jgi:tetratricopeptide (TPR) repeat protein
MTLRSRGTRIKNYIANHIPMFVAGVAVLAVAVFLVLRFEILIQDLYEDISFAIAPSGQKAYDYGVLHFNAQDPSEYDIDRAFRYFQDAEKLDPTLPYVHHELARIYFLNGDFGDAMLQIDIQIAQEGDKTPNSYYVRGLIEGYMGDYTDAEADYAYFLKFDPEDWAGINDYAWVLLKAGHPQEAVDETAYGLKYFPASPWLLNTNAIALYEIGLIGPALDQEKAAVAAGANMTVQDWLHAYPGNDPKIAEEGIAAFQAAAANNMHTIELAGASSTLELGATHD